MPLNQAHILRRDLARAKRRTERLQAQLDAIRPPEPEQEGTGIRFFKTIRNHRYTYLAVKSDRPAYPERPWYTTGPQNSQYSWDGLLDWLGEDATTIEVICFPDTGAHMASPPLLDLDVDRDDDCSSGVCPAGC